MSKLPSTYPFLEPCPGCFENAIQALSEQPGSPVFFGNGDFTLTRMLTALCKLVPDPEIMICTYTCMPETLADIHSLVKKDGLKEAIIFSSDNRVSVDPVANSDSIHIIDAGVNFFLVQARNPHRSITISGVFMQDFPSRRLEMYTMHNDPDQQELIRQTIHKSFRKQIAYVRNR